MSAEMKYHSVKDCILNNYTFASTFLNQFSCMKNLLIIVLLGLCFTGIAQDNQFVVSGKVMDSANQQLLSGASVFCQNTTLGTISNAEGRFSLKLPNGGYDLIVSYTGYESRVIRISNTETEPLQIQLKQKDKSLQEVAVVSSSEVADGLAKYGQFFTDNFIGNTGNGVQCKIQNPEALQFFFSKKRNRLKVKAKEDLIIINNALGYKIKFQLDSFAHEYNNSVSVYTGFPFFEELPGTEDQKTAWKKNRLKAYNGSRLHFVRSWYQQNLTAEGFAIEQVDPYSTNLKTTEIENPYDTLLFKVQEDKDIEINYNGKLRVIFKKALPDARYLAESKLPSYLKSQISILEVNDGFVIQQNGYFYDQNDVTNIGYWSWLKLGDALPYDYKPE